ncbi:MAG: SpoIIE family protein phosphatase [Selenomonadaceae bacterium]|nr:SpoIIE family protein phosphatase [Selenomonadaceae bacterium]
MTLGSLAFYAMDIVKNGMDKLGERVSVAGTEFTEELMLRQFKETLEDLAESRANFIDYETYLIREDVDMMSKLMTRIASNPDDWRPIKLRDPRVDTVQNFDPYVIYSPETYLNGMSPENLSPEIRREIELAANIRAYMRPLAKSFGDYKSSFYVGSKNGWTVCISVLPNVRGELPFEDEELYHYDCRTRPWYVDAVNAGKSVFSDPSINIGADEFRFISCSAPYFDRNGEIAGVVGLGVSSEEIYAAISETAVSDDGFSFVLNKNGEVIFSSYKGDKISAKVGGQDLRLSSRQNLAEAATRMVNGETGTVLVTVDGEEYFLAFAPLKTVGWSFGTLTPRRDISIIAEAGRDYFLEQVDIFGTRLQSEFFLIIFAVLILLGWFLNTFVSASKALSARFVRPINELSDGVREIAGGNYEKTLNIKTDDEIKHLEICFNAMSFALKEYTANLTKTTAEKQRIQTELDIAADIQSGMLPKDFPTRDDIEILAKMTPAKEVGGDFYDFYMLDKTHVVITVADVSGKGIPAALFMGSSKTVLNNFIVRFYKENGLELAVTAANEKICSNNEAMMFVTAFIGVLDLETGEFTFVNAGHNPPVLYRAEKNSCEFLDVKKNFVLGPMDGIPFAEQKISFKRGDLLFVYTDGVTEALNVKNEEYLPDRLIKFMNTTDCRVDLKTLLKNIRADVAEHVGEAEQSDDITLFAFRYNGSHKNEA